MRYCITFWTNHTCLAFIFENHTHVNLPSWNGEKRPLLAPWAGNPGTAIFNLVFTPPNLLNSWAFFIEEFQKFLECLRKLARNSKDEENIRNGNLTSHEITIFKGTSIVLPSASSSVIGSIFQHEAKPMGTSLRDTIPLRYFLIPSIFSSRCVLRSQVSLNED